MTNPKSPSEIAEEIFRRWSDAITFHMTEEYSPFVEGKRFLCTKEKVSFYADEYINAFVEALAEERRLREEAESQRNFYQESRDHFKKRVERGETQVKELLDTLDRAHKVFGADSDGIAKIVKELEARLRLAGEM